MAIIGARNRVLSRGRAPRHDRRILWIAERAGSNETVARWSDAYRPYVNTEKNRYDRRAIVMGSEIYRGPSRTSMNSRDYRGAPIEIATVVMRAFKPSQMIMVAGGNGALFRRFFVTQRTISRNPACRFYWLKFITPWPTLSLTQCFENVLSHSLCVRTYTSRPCVSSSMHAGHRVHSPRGWCSWSAGSLLAKSPDKESNIRELAFSYVSRISRSTL